MLAPFLNELRRQEQKSNIILVCRTGLKDIASILPVNKIIEVDKPNRKSRLSILNASNGGYKTCYCTFAGAWLALLSTIPIRMLISHADPKGRLPRLIDQYIRIPEDPTSIPEVFFHNSGIHAPKINTIPADNWHPRGHFAVLHLGARSAARQLSQKQIKVIVERLSKHISGQILLTGSIGEGPAFSDIYPSNQTHGIRLKDLRGKTTLVALKKIIQCARVVVTVDTGIAHLSKALGTPTFILFGQSQPGIFGKDNTYSRSHHFGIENLACRDKHTLHGHHVDWISTCNRNICPIPGRPCLPEDLPHEALSRLSTLLLETEMEP